MSMVSVANVTMKYPQPKRYVDLIKNPFVKKYYVALSCVNIEINKGDKVAFLGANGAGKTTLLKIIGGLLYPSEGYVKVNGFDTIKNNLNARKTVGSVLNEERSFYWRLTGRQNLQFFGVLDNLYGKEIDSKIDELTKLVGLDDACDKLFAGYSSGMKQKLAIARGLLSAPEILILDEPTRTLDPISAEDVKNLLKDRIHTKNEKTLLIATHRLDEAEILCNKVCIMKKGQIMLFDKLEKLLSKHGSLINCYNSVMAEQTQDAKEYLKTEAI